MKNKRLSGFLFFAIAAVFFIVAQMAQAATSFPIAVTTGREISLSAAFDGTNYMVGFQEAVGESLNIKAQLVSQSGTLVGSAIAVGLTGGAPAVAFDGTNYLLVSPLNASSIQGQFVSAAGAPVGSPFNITPSGSNINYENFILILHIIFDGNNYFVMWNETEIPVTYSDGGYLKGQFVSPAGGLIGDPITICAGTGPYLEIPGTFNVGFDGNTILTVWNDGRRLSVCGEGFCPLDIYGQFITKSGVGTSGALSGSNFAINVNDDWSDMSTLGIAFDGTNYLVAWNDMTPYTENARLYAQLVSTSGTLVGGVIDTANTTANFERDLPFLAFDGNNYLLMWTSTANDLNGNYICDAGEGTCFDIYGQYISTSGSFVGSEFAINTDSGNQFGALIYGGGKYLALINNIDTFDGAVGDVYGAFLGGAGTGTHNASGAYTWDSGTGLLEMNWAISDFICDGPELGLAYETGVIITDTTMTWSDGMTWTREPGTPGDIVAVWTSIDPRTGNSYTLTINADLTMSVVGNIVVCGDDSDENPRAQSQHWSNGYYVPLQYEDSPQTATSVSVTGPGISGSINLAYDTNWGGWNSWNPPVTPFLGTTYPAGLPYTYAFTITDGTGTWPADSIVSCFQEQFATNLSPTGTITTGTPTFSWTGIADTGVEYGLELHDSNYNRIWYKWDIYGTSIVYNGPTLTPGMTYNYNVVVESSSACSNGQSFAQGSFTYGAAPLYIAWTDDTYGNNEIFLKKSTDNGATWTFQRLTNNSGNSQFPKVAVSGNNVYVVWQDDTYAAGVPEIFLKRSADSGATWQFQRLTTNTGSSFTPDVVASGNNVYVVWEDNTYGNAEIFLKKSIDGGNTWTFQRLTNNTGVSMNPSIRVNGNNVYVVWQDDTYAAGVPEIFLKRSADSGATWQFQRLTNNIGNSQAPVVAVNGNEVYVVWQDDSNGNNEIFLKKSINGGNTWTFQRLTNNAGTSGRPSIALSSSNIYVVWEDDTYVAGVPEIFFKKSADGGNTWTFQRLTNNTGSSGRPSMALSSSNIYVVWEDNTYGNYEIFFKKSIDNGATWSFQRLTTNTGNSVMPAMAR